jgi:hypothetical protein
MLSDTQKPPLTLITFYVGSPYISYINNTQSVKISMLKIMFPEKSQTWISHAIKFVVLRPTYLTVIHPTTQNIVFLFICYICRAP